MALEEISEEQLFELSDEDLEARFLEAKAENETSDDTEDNVEETEPETSEDNTEDENEDSVDDEVEDEEEEASNSDEGQPDGEPESEEDETETTEPATQSQEFADLKVDGKMIPIGSMEELYALASGGGNITQKFQKIAGHKKSISIMEEQGISESDLSILAQIKSGDKDALATLVKQSGIDYMEITDEINPGFNPNAHVPTDNQISIREVQDSISVDPEYSITQNVVNNMMDDVSQNTLVQNPEMIRGLHEDIKSGAYQHTRAQADKLKLMDSGKHSDMEYYIAAAKQQGSEPQEQYQEPEVQERPTRSSNKSKKRSAGSTRSKNLPDTRKSADDMSDDELMAFREEIMSRN